MKIYDCFTFFNELELLELRLMTLDKIVDWFVIVEADRTHSGKPKEFIFEKYSERFQKYLPKIRYIKTGLPYNSPWPNENFQRNAIVHGLTDAESHDYIMISDLDEIPNPQGVLDGIHNRHWDQFVMEQKLTYYYVNNIAGQNWHGTVVLKKHLMVNPQWVRDAGRQRPPCVILEGGWHYSFMGGLNKIVTKLESYAETQTNNPEINNIDHILHCLQTGNDLFKRDDDERYAKKFVPVEEMKHPELTEWLKKYPNFAKI